jgi:hypothetical protein
MPRTDYTRTRGQQYTYSIEYDDGHYFIHRDGRLVKSVPDAIVAGVLPSEAGAEFMLRTAIADIELLEGMEE